MGISKVGPPDVAAIVNGQGASSGEYPAMVSFSAVGCGGSLIAKRLVLTAAHCIPNTWGASANGQYFDLSGIRAGVAFVGLWKQRPSDVGNNDLNTATRAIVGVIIHQNYD